MQDKNVSNLLERYPKLQMCRAEIIKAYEYMVDTYNKGGKLLIVGNGGSASDADHIVGELMKGFRLRREIDKDFGDALMQIDMDRGRNLSSHLQQSLPAIALTNHNSLNTAFLNDVNGEMCFAQQVYGYGKTEDCLLAISTSGNSENVILAAVTAKAKGMSVIALTGNMGGMLKEISDVAVIVPEQETYKIQELHLPVYHTLCLMLEERFFITNLQ